MARGAKRSEEFRLGIYGRLALQRISGQRDETEKRGALDGDLTEEVRIQKKCDGRERSSGRFT